VATVPERPAGASTAGVDGWRGRTTSARRRVEARHGSPLPDEVTHGTGAVAHGFGRLGRDPLAGNAIGAMLREFARRGVRRPLDSAAENASTTGLGR